MDPARRSETGKKVFLIEDCSPDVLTLRSDIFSHCRHILLKLSPMADITMACTRLGSTCREVHVVAYGGECKELLIWMDKEWSGEYEVKAVELPADYPTSDESSFTFKPAEEKTAAVRFAVPEDSGYLFEPGKAMMKSGCFNLISERLHAIDPDVVIYGEGWAAEAPAYPAEEIALKANTYMLDGIGAFSDNIRDAVRGPLGCENAGFMDGVAGNKENIHFGIAGGVEHPQASVERWTSNPLQHVSYVSCHDDHCLRDRLEEATKATEKERLAMVKLAQTAVYTSQGIPFIFNGEELYRHKQGVKNSYNKPDSINAIDWTYKTTYKDLVDYYAGLAAIRHSHPGFCLGDAELVRQKLQFIEVNDPCVVAFRISGLEGIDSAKSLTVLLNGSKKAAKVEIPQGNYTVLAKNGQADAEGLGAYSGNTISAAATSATILAEN